MAVSCKVYLFYFKYLLFMITFLDGFNARNFTIDYENDTFLKDGRPFRFISGTIHFARTPQYYWRDRLMKMRAAGYNAVQTYVFWNFHEPQPGQYDFSGQRDLVAFLREAQDCGLHVILRGIPYSCAEWDFGGLPGWLLKDTPNIVVRTMDPAFIKPLDRWLDVLLNKIKPMLYKNGGPIISVQVENEYGSYSACDFTYLRYLRQRMVATLGHDVVLFTTDGAGLGFLKCGALQGVYACVDFGVTYDPEKAFAPQRIVQPHGPLVNSEFYIGWLDHWSQNHSHIDVAACAKSLDILLAYGANINQYVFAGGSSFGFYNGANYPPYQPVTTSYDFDGVLSEAGDITPKYLAIRKVISKYNPLPPGPVPPSTPKKAYGRVKLTYVANVYEMLNTIAHPPVYSTYPLTMEHIGQYYGFTLYRHTTTVAYNTTLLSVPGLRDRAYVAVGEEPYGVLEREGHTSITLGRIGVGDDINILVENQGHVNHGSGLNNNSKGIIGNLTLDGKIVTKWSMFAFKLDTVWPEDMVNQMVSRPRREPIRRQRGNAIYTLPSLYMGVINVTGSPQDTYLDPRPFTKGQAFINSANVGRYWPVAGPQVTLFVPKGFLRDFAKNFVTLLELEHAPHREATYCSFTAEPFINKTVPSSSQRDRSGRRG